MDKQRLFRFAREHGYNQETLEKMWRLTEVLRSFNSDPLLGKCLALRGGTAINLVILKKLYRLSEDLDFDFSCDTTKEEMLEYRTKIQDLVNYYMLPARYSLNPKSSHYYALDSLRYNYTSFSGGNNKLKVEINYMIRQHVLPLERLDVSFPLLEQPLSILAVAPLETMAFKISALLRRAAPRDHFDVYNFVTSGLYASPEERELLRRLIVFYQVIEYDEPHEPLTPEAVINLDALNRLSSLEIRNKLLPMLPRGETYNIDEAQEVVQAFLQEILILQENEIEFIKRFAQKDYQPKLLFGETFGNNITGHPMALWKTR